MKAHNLQIKSVIGGTPYVGAYRVLCPHIQVLFHSIGQDLRYFQARSPNILVATPGRLHDLLTKPGSMVHRHLEGLQTMIYDEADRYVHVCSCLSRAISHPLVRLLDAGFAPALKQIAEQLPPRADRQNLLFSATFSDQIKSVCQSSPFLTNILTHAKDCQHRLEPRLPIHYNLAAP